VAEGGWEVKEETFAFIGIWPCGCGKAVIHDDPKDPKWVAKEKRDWIKRGCSEIRRLTPKECHALFGLKCDACKTKYEKLMTERGAGK
jgi:hypothetical protein